MKFDETLAKQKHAFNLGHRRTTREGGRAKVHLFGVCGKGRRGTSITIAYTLGLERRRGVGIKFGLVEFGLQNRDFSGLR